MFLVSIAVARLVHYRKVLQKFEAQVDALTKTLIVMVLMNGLHWGLLTTWILTQPELEKLHYPAMIVVAAFALGGTATLSISRSIRILYPLCIYCPPIGILIFLKFSPEYVLLATLALFSLVYIMDAAKMSSKDYWEAISSRQMADQRAKQLERLSITDPLTQLSNRMYFNERYQEEWKRGHRLGIFLSVLMIDLDHFKRINDTHGHFFGDECLREFAATLKQLVPRDTDVVARYGGEEFIVLLPGTELSGAQRIAEKIVKKSVRLKADGNDQVITLTCSIGIACARPNYRDKAETLLHAADEALYAAKSGGRNRWVSSEQKLSG
ncbi:MAG: GGDEF domain-containing protein [Candidatus Thiodiazotropha sp.]